jgi:hypothetical protein
MSLRDTDTSRQDIGGDWCTDANVPDFCKLCVRRRQIKPPFHPADESLPGRWLATPDAAFAADRDEPLPPSRVGPHNCIGSQLAYAGMPLILATLIRSWIRPRCRAEIDSGAGAWNPVG